MAFPLAFLALLTERIFGYPQRLFALIGHPVTWIGALISLLDRHWNSEQDTDATRRTAGIMALLVIVGGSATLTLILQAMLGKGMVAILIMAVLCSSLIAQKSLFDHVEAVAEALEREGLEGGRRAVSMIVGRDPQSLDEGGVARAAIESLAENFSDGVTAPAFWLGVLGPAGGVAYKAANTADSMIGHRSARHLHFGWAAAQFDDLINLPASRLTALLFVVAARLLPGASTQGAWAAICRDAGKHRSPNAGWPEAAMAGALGLALAGPRTYGGVLVDDHFMGEGGRREANAADIRRALRLARLADALMIGLFGAVAAVTLAAAHL